MNSSLYSQIVYRMCSTRMALHRGPGESHPQDTKRASSTESRQVDRRMTNNYNKMGLDRGTYNSSSVIQFKADEVQTEIMKSRLIVFTS